MSQIRSHASKVIEGYGIMLGMIIGAGIFGLPYAFSKAPLHWNLLLFAAIFFITWLMHDFYAGIIYITPGKHRFPGYVQRYLGPRAETIATIFTILSVYGAMLAYGILGAIFLQNIFGIEFFTSGIIFFIFGGALFLLPLDSVGKIDFYMTIPVLFFAVFLAAKLFPAVSAENFIVSGNISPFFSYGVLVFALGGYSGLPDLHDILGSSQRALFKRIIFWSIFISALLYLVFIFSVLGVVGSNVTEDAISGLSGVLGKSGIILGSLIGIFAVFRSYITFGADLKLTFRYDYGISKNTSWLLAFIPPVSLFLAGFIDLVKVLSIVGSVGLGVFAIFILLMVNKKRKEVFSFVGFSPRPWMLAVLGILFLLGALQDLMNI